MIHPASLSVIILYIEALLCKSPRRACQIYKLPGYKSHTMLEVVLTNDQKISRYQGLPWCKFSWFSTEGSYYYVTTRLKIYFSLHFLMGFFQLTSYKSLDTKAKVFTSKVGPLLGIYASSWRCWSNYLEEWDWILFYMHNSGNTQSIAIIQSFTESWINWLQNMF